MLDQSKLQIVEYLVNQIQNLFGSPYRTMIIYGAPDYDKSAIIMEVAKRQRLRYIDFLKEVLVLLDPPGLETYNRSKLLDYIRRTIDQSKTGVIFDELEGLFATWEPSNVLKFFANLCGLKVKFPNIIVTSQMLDFTELGFDSNRVSRLE